MPSDKKSNQHNDLETVPSPNLFPRLSTNFSLNIALYPWATNEHLQQYQRVIEYYWYEVLNNKDVHLNWLNENQWDGGYHKLPQDYFDLYIYDTMFLNSYHSQGWLCELDREEITSAHELNPKLLSCSRNRDGKYCGIPIYGCLYVLFYRSSDQELAAIKTFDELFHLASKRNFLMRKPSRTLKTWTYFTLDENHRSTEENLNRHLISRLSDFYTRSKYLLEKNDRIPFDHSSFYIGFTEDLNTMLLVNDEDFSQIDLMFVPSNGSDQSQCWLDCIGIHPLTKSRQTYEKSLQLANLMISSTVMNECFHGQIYVIPSNQVTLTHLASKCSIYGKLHSLIESTLFRPSSEFPLATDSSLSIDEQWAQAMRLIIAQHQKEMQLFFLNH